MKKRPIMICTFARGGMRSVVEGYKTDGLVDKWEFRILWSHYEGSLFSRLKIAVISWFKMFWLLLCNKVSFIHVHTAMYGSFWRKGIFSQTARLFKVPVVLHLHGSEMQAFYNSSSTLAKRVICYVLETAKCVIVLSASWREFVKSIAPKANVVIINNYVSIPTDIIIRPSNNQFNVLFLGIVGHRKGAFDLLQAWSFIVKQLPFAKLLIGGNGSVDEAKRLSEELGIKNQVEFLGWVSGDEKIRYLKNADVFVLPSYNEGLPMSVLEAMSWQKPVVTTKVGGIPELIIDSYDGFLIEPGNVEQLKDAILELYNNEELRRQIAINAREKIVHQYSSSSILPKLEEIYIEVLKH